MVLSYRRDLAAQGEWVSAVFLAALFAATRGTGRTLPGLAWESLFPFKFIAILFLPPAIVADWITERLRFAALVRRYLPAVLATAGAVGFISHPVVETSGFQPDSF